LTEMNITSQFPRTFSATLFSFYLTTSSCVYVSKAAHTQQTPAIRWKCSLPMSSPSQKPNTM